MTTNEDMRNDEELSAKKLQIRKRTFAEWVKKTLDKKNHGIKNLSEELEVLFQKGENLAKLLQALSGQEVVGYTTCLKRKDNIEMIDTCFNSMETKNGIKLDRDKVGE